MNKNLFLAVFSVLFAYGVAEALATFCYVKGWIEPYSIWFLEKHGPGISHVSFDPVIGYRLSSRPTRMGAYTTVGGVQTWASSRGNNLGFPDFEDFNLKRSHENQIRVAVFGDSFSASQYLSKPWPEQAEELLERRGLPIEIMNFSIDGGGLGNWWSTIVGLIEKEKMEIDAFVFAVWSTDLNRSFMLWDDEAYLELNWPQAEVGAQYMQDWDTNKFPKSRDELILGPLKRFFLLSSNEVDLLLAGKLSLPTDRNWDPFLWKLFWHQVTPVAQADNDSIPPPLGGFSDPGKLKLIQEIRTFAEGRRIKIFVVNNADNYFDGVGFANLLDAEMIDGSQVYNRLRSFSQGNYFIPLDGHFMQKGADQFADFMAEKIEHWYRSGKFQITSRPGQ
ncbi:MAG: hypothetical protein H6624_01540 [Bdellovibrionaceae bacterium]|nr:hypothetical protein [Bdellovibrionales bacterium]MCB9082991.1 hypothetical protein [Pseudobdellovibrionaceae bacterium]